MPRVAPACSSLKIKMQLLQLLLVYDESQPLLKMSFGSRRPGRDEGGWIASRNYSYALSCAFSPLVDETVHTFIHQECHTLLIVSALKTAAAAHSPNAVTVAN